MAIKSAEQWYENTEHLQFERFEHTALTHTIESWPKRNHLTLHSFRNTNTYTYRVPLRVTVWLCGGNRKLQYFV